jgi:hypothetical protein
VTACPTKVVPGTYGFVAQLNEGRYSKKRPTEFRVDQVLQVRRRTSSGDGTGSGLCRGAVERCCM